MADLIEHGAPEKIWYGEEVCKACGCRQRLKLCDVHARLEAMQGDVTGLKTAIRTVYWFVCLECHENNYISIYFRQ